MRRRHSARPRVGPPRPPARYTVAFAVVAVFLLFVLVLLPFAVASVVEDIADPQSHRVFDLTPDGPRPPSRTHLNLDVVSVDEWAGTVTLRVTGQHICANPCAWTAMRVSLVSVPEQYAQGQGLPPAVEVLFPAERAQPVNQTVTLPVNGEPVRYPFDRYGFTLGFLVGYVYPAGAAPPPGPPDQPAGQPLFASLRSTAPRMTVSAPAAVGPAELAARDVQLGFTAAVRMTFSRPVYLQVLTVLLVLLVTAAAAYAVFLRPLQELVVNSGALVLGVWGIRAVLLGAAVPGLTAVDLALSVVILFLLLALTARTALYLSARGGVRIPMGRRAADRVLDVETTPDRRGRPPATDRRRASHCGRTRDRGHD